MAEKESQWLLNMLLDWEALSTALGNSEAFAVACNESKNAIHCVDDELSILRCRKVQDGVTIMAHQMPSEFMHGKRDVFNYMTQTFDLNNSMQPIAGDHEELLPLIMDADHHLQSHHIPSVLVHGICCPPNPNTYHEDNFYNGPPLPSVQVHNPPPPDVHNTPLHNNVYNSPHEPIPMPPQDRPLMGSDLNPSFPEMQSITTYDLTFLQINNNFSYLAQGSNPIPLPQQNIGHYFPQFPIPMLSMDSRSMLPSAAEDIPPITNLIPTSNHTSLVPKSRWASKKPYKLQIIKCSGQQQKQPWQKAWSQASQHLSIQMQLNLY
ncbi:hypothetical protein BDR04DRAFT_1118914 [Suillus decipiens]|nr:hypothetical protein BDR04DRAFT_1118914 [Suillus decipiens]